MYHQGEPTNNAMMEVSVQTEVSEHYSILLFVEIYEVGIFSGMVPFQLLPGGQVSYTSAGSWLCSDRNSKSIKEISENVLIQSNNK